MNLSFLCSHHKDWLQNQPIQSIQFCANTWERGLAMCEQNDWELALPYVGCAYEAALIMYSSRVIPSHDALSFVIQTFESLMETLGHLGREDDCNTMRLAAIGYLSEELAQDSSMKMPLILQINRLNQCIRQSMRANDKSSDAKLKRAKVVSLF